MFEETRFLTAANVFIHSVTAHRDGVDLSRLSYPPDELEPAAIGQTDVAQKQVELLRLRDAKRLRHIFRAQDLVAETSEKKFQRTQRVLMIFHQKNAKRTRSGCGAHGHRFLRGDFFFPALSSVGKKRPMAHAVVAEDVLRE